MSAMENDSRFRAATLAVLLARQYADATPFEISRLVFNMQKAARAAVAWETKRCNVAMTEQQEELGSERLMHLQNNINSSLSLRAGEGEPCKVKLGGDPRGSCASLLIPGERGDGWGEGFAIF